MGITLARNKPSNMKPRIKIVGVHAFSFSDNLFHKFSTIKHIHPDKPPQKNYGHFLKTEDTPPVFMPVSSVLHVHFIFSLTYGHQNLQYAMLIGDGILLFFSAKKKPDVKRRQVVSERKGRSGTILNVELRKDTISKRPHFETGYLVSIHKWLFYPISALCSDFNPRNIPIYSCG
jgi:hypothetical protein